MPSLIADYLLPLFIVIIYIPSFTHSLSTAPKHKMKYEYQPNIKNYQEMKITSLHRYALKGLAGDSLTSIELKSGEGTFEDDRRYALLYEDSREEFDEENPCWVYKENFLCAFTAPELLATLDTSYTVESNNNDAKRRLLTVWNRKLGRSSKPLLGPVDLACSLGREETSQFFTQLCGRKVICVVASDASKKSSGDSNLHTHQFGNTSTGEKNGGDTRTLHIINEETVKQFSDAVYGESEDVSLSSTQFRANICVNNLEPWAEFDLIGKTIEVVPKSGDNDTATPLRLRIVSRTVRCAGVGVDPEQPNLGVIDIPNLLTKHFPQHGPYLGVYAVVENDNNTDDENCKRTISVGDTLRVV